MHLFPFAKNRVSEKFKNVKSNHCVVVNYNTKTNASLFFAAPHNPPSSFYLYDKEQFNLTLWVAYLLHPSIPQSNLSLLSSHFSRRSRQHSFRLIPGVPQRWHGMYFFDLNRQLIQTGCPYLAYRCVRANRVHNERLNARQKTQVPCTYNQYSAAESGRFFQFQNSGAGMTTDVGARRTNLQWRFEFYGPLSLTAVILCMIAAHLTLLRVPYFWDETYFAPAARDLFLTGKLIPISVPVESPPPLVYLWIAIWWKLFGFSILVARTSMLAVAALTLAAVYRLARLLTSGAVPIVVTALTAIYPVFFVES